MPAQWKCPRLWPKGNAVIIGGGPSFKKVPCDVLKRLSLDEKIGVIGINKAYREIPDFSEWGHVIFFGDDRFYKVFSKKPDGFYKFPGLRVSCAGRKNDNAIHFLGRNRKKGHGICKQSHLVCWNKNSGGSAINLAYHLVGGGGKVFLFGFDMKKAGGGDSHWHNGYAGDFNQRKNHDVKIPFQRWLKTFPAIARDAERLKLEIYNVGSPNSKIDEFPKITFNEFLEMVDKKREKLDD